MQEFIDGFDQYLTGAVNVATGGLWINNSSGGSPDINTAQPNHGSLSLRVLPQAGQPRSAERAFISGQVDRIYIGCNFYFESPYTFVGSRTGFQLAESGSVNDDKFVLVPRGENSRWNLYRNTALLATSNQLVSPNAYIPLRMYYEVGAPGFDGNLKVIVGNEVIFDGPVTSFNGNAAPRGADRMRCGHLGNIGYYDDCFAISNPTPSEILQLDALQGWAILDSPPISNGPNQDWSVVGAASAFEALNNRPPNIAEYIEGAAVTDVSSFNYQNLSTGPTTVASVLGCAHYYYAEKSDAAPGSVQAYLNGGGGASNPLSENPLFYADNYEINPATGMSWAPGDLANLVTDFERTA